MDNDTPVKCCSKCGVEYPATDEYFPRRKSGTLRADCRVCARNKTKEWRLLHPDRPAKWREENPEYQKKWYQKNKDEHLRRTKERYDANPEAKQAKNREWQKSNPESKRKHSRAHAARRKAWKLGNGGTFTKSDIDLMYRLQKERCWWCGVKLKGKYEIDHRIPLSRGGSNAPENLCLTCANCNRSKRAKLPHEWSDRLL